MYVDTLITLQENLATYAVEGKKVTGHVTMNSPGMIKCYIQNLKGQGTGNEYVFYAFSKSKDKGVRIGKLGKNKETKWIVDEKNVQSTGLKLEELDAVAIVAEKDMRGVDTVAMGFKNNRYIIIPLIDDIVKSMQVKQGYSSKEYTPLNGTNTNKNLIQPDPIVKGINPVSKDNIKSNAQYTVKETNQYANTLGQGEPSNAATNTNIGSQPSIGSNTNMGNQGSVGNSTNMGSQGSVGSSTNMGSQGSVGSSANMGNQGSIGNSTNMGNQGSVGSSANMGSQGSVGSSANMGNQGSVGSSANKGNQGGVGSSTNMGSQGSVGSSTNMGNQGSVGSSTNMGNQGSIGSNTNMGNQGSVGNSTNIAYGNINNSTTPKSDISKNTHQTLEEGNIQKVPLVSGETHQIIAGEGIEDNEATLIKIAEKLQEVEKEPAIKNTGKSGIPLATSQPVPATVVRDDFSIDNSMPQDDEQIETITKKTEEELERIIARLKEDKTISSKIQDIEQELVRFQRQNDQSRVENKINIEEKIEARYISKQVEESENRNQRNIFVEEVESEEQLKDFLDTSPKNALTFIQDWIDNFKEKGLESFEYVKKPLMDKQQSDQEEIDYISEIDRKIKEIEERRKQETDK